MGTLIYDSVEVHFDDRLLSHLHVVITQKLRRNESFNLSWRDADSVGDGRSSIWLNPAIPLYFKFAGSKMPGLNHDWLVALANAANSNYGLVIFNENALPAHGDDGSRIAGTAPPQVESVATIADADKHLDQFVSQTAKV